MAEISKIVKDAGIKAAFSFAAPGKASDIQYIIEQLGYACEKYEGARYDYIGVNIYPDAHNDNYVKTLKNTVEEKAAGKQMIIPVSNVHGKIQKGKTSIKNADKEHL